MLQINAYQMLDHLVVRCSEVHLNDRGRVSTIVLGATSVKLPPEVELDSADGLAFLGEVILDVAYGTGDDPESPF